MFSEPNASAFLMQILCNFLAKSTQLRRIFHWGKVAVAVLAAVLGLFTPLMYKFNFK